MKTNQFRLSPVFCAYNKIVVDTSNSSKVIIGMLDEENFELRRKIQKAFFAAKQNTEIVFEKISVEEFERQLAKTFSKEIVKISDTNLVNNKNQNNFEDKAKEEPVVNLLNSILIDAINSKATDVHIENGKVRFRLNGLLKDFMIIPQNYFESVVLRIKVLAKLDLSENRYAQDGRFDFSWGDRNIDIRVSVVPVFHGESVVLRILIRNYQLMSFEQLGFSENQIKKLNQMLLARHNLILVCGPTGSGKSTTSAVMLESLKDKGLKIISLEDPVEYELEGVTQIPVRPEINLDFNELLRRVFRQDPDVLMIGEIRDTQTAETAVRFAGTGHLVIATLHTSCCSVAALRMIDLGVKPYMLVSVLHSIISQKLITNENNERKLKAEILTCDSEFLKLLEQRPSAEKLENYVNSLECEAC